MGHSTDAPTDYEWDVFISYRRLQTIEQWLDQAFQQLLFDYLYNELNRAPTIFIDRPKLRDGDKWSLKLARALLCSRCLVPIGSGDYFSSGYCATEFEAFRERSRLTSGAELIVPVRWHDWQPLPAPLSEMQIQAADFTELSWTRVRTSDETSVPFEKRMRQFCSALADKIKRAPKFNPEWHALILMPSNDDIRPPDIKHPRQGG